MNKTVTIALASLLAVSPVAGVAYAQETLAVPADSMSTGSISADTVQVVLMADLQGDDSKREDFARLEAKANTPAEVEKAQAELASTPGLTEILTSKNVQLQNVIAIDTAANGGKIVYVK
jgi:hypothetical protein